MNITGGNALLDVNFILDKVKVGEKTIVADLGSGSSGHFVFPTAKIVGKNGKVYAVDILKTNLENIEKRSKVENFDNVEAVWSDLEIFGATKIEAGSLDVAMLVNTLYQSSKRVEIIREAARMLKKNGKLVIVEWKNTASPLGPPVEERVKIDSLKAGGPKLGLNLEEEFEAGPYHFGLIFVKL